MADLIHDYSALSTAAACWRRYLYQYVLRLVREDEADPPYLHAGSVGHKALYTLYTNPWEDGLERALEVAREEWGSFTPAGKHDYLTLGHFLLCLEDYYEDRSKRPTALEQADAVESRGGAEDPILFDWEGPTGEVLSFGGIPDLPSIFAGQRYIIDNKFTTSWLNDNWALKFRLGHQFRVYCAALHAKTGVTYDGAYVNAIYIGQPPKSGWGKVKSVQNRLFGPYHYTPAQLEETWEWARGLLKTKELNEEMGLWPQNEGHCSAYGGCPYLDLCERTPELRPALMSMQYKKQPAEGRLVSGADG